jgi:single-stranded DNA-binding protein
MSETTLTMAGNLVADPELRYTPAAVAVVNFRIASTERYKGENGWQDGDTAYMSCTAWRGLAENVAESARRGDRVIVTGRIKQRTYETRERARSGRPTSWTPPTSGFRSSGPRPGRSRPSARAAAVVPLRVRPRPGCASGAASTTTGTARTGGRASRSSGSPVPGARLASPEAGSATPTRPASYRWPGRPTRRMRENHAQASKMINGQFQDHSGGGRRWPC